MWSQQWISIHAPREGSDTTFVQYLLARLDFYPRSPRGERRVLFFFSGDIAPFLSTLPARGATGRLTLCCHAYAFLSTLPARGATQCLVALDAQAEISIHAPREGSDTKAAA